MNRRKFLGSIGIAACAATTAAIVKMPDPDMLQIPEFVGSEGIGISCLSGIAINGIDAKNVSGWYPHTGEVDLVEFTGTSPHSTRHIRPRSVEPLWRKGHGPDGDKCILCSPWRRVYRRRP